MKTDPEQIKNRNYDLEIALVKIARVIYDYTASQEDYRELDRLGLLFDNFSPVADDYCNQTGGLHPDLGYELSEWATFKSELLAPNHEQRKREGKSNIDRRFVDGYGKTANDIIKGLESDLGLAR